ncbi:MAG: hypothetical protein ACTTKZ_06550, partial [Bacteroides sp.]
MSFQGLQEEELKLRIGEEFFSRFDCHSRIGKIDFCVSMCKTSTHTNEMRSLLWAEAKRGSISDIYKPLVQLILTIGKVRTFDSYLPPLFLASFDAEKIAFLPYKEILPFFSLNDFNWNVAPSDDATREFGLLYDTVKTTIDHLAYIFRYEAHEKELREFIRVHISENFESIQINKNNFVSIYQRWLAQVQPSIDVHWEEFKKRGITDGDFFLADLLSDKNQTFKEALYVLLKDNRYMVDRKIDTSGMFNESTVFFKDQQKAHAQFWDIYQRSSKEECWDYIIQRRDLLVPQDARERKGSFFTPKIWVDLSQKYLADVLGENWQDEYYVWDCAAGTGNLLNGLTNKYNTWASTLDQQDVDVMKDRIKNGANLLESHVFQFDFLNDEFDCGKLPTDLLTIIQNPEERKKLVIYINPPYAEASNTRTSVGSGKNRSRLSSLHDSYKRFRHALGQASKELFVLFLFRIYTQLNGAIIANFSTPKISSAPNFKDFREKFCAMMLRAFLVPAFTFDNVSGKFPVAFYVWNTSAYAIQRSHIFDVYTASGAFLQTKRVLVCNNRENINQWRNTVFLDRTKQLGFLQNQGADFQNYRTICLCNKTAVRHSTFTPINTKTLLLAGIYFSVRLVVPPTWLNNHDQFFYPKDGWQVDTLFQNNCLTFMLFHPKNHITSFEGTNHWIPFTEVEVDAQSCFESHFMTDFISGSLYRTGDHSTSDQNKFINPAGCSLHRQHGVSTAVVFTPDRRVVRQAVKINEEASPPQSTSNTSLFSEEHKTSF